MEKEVIFGILAFIGGILIGALIGLLVGADDVSGYVPGQDAGLTYKYMWMAPDGTHYTCDKSLQGEFIGCTPNLVILLSNDTGKLEICVVFDVDTIDCRKVGNK